MRRPASRRRKPRACRWWLPAAIIFPSSSRRAPWLLGPRWVEWMAGIRLRTRALHASELIRYISGTQDASASQAVAARGLDDIGNACESITLDEQHVGKSRDR